MSRKEAEEKYKANPVNEVCGERESVKVFVCVRENVCVREKTREGEREGEWKREKPLF